MSETKEKKISRKGVLIALGIICIVLVAGLTVSIVVYTSIIRDRDNTISSLNSRVSGLQTQVNGLVNQTVQSSLCYGEFGSVSIMSRSYNFSPPISMYDALRIALESGGWNASSLAKMVVRVGLEYMWFNASGSWPIHDMTQPAKDYSPVQVNGTTYRYVWFVNVDQIPFAAYPPPGYYYVDAATGEIVSPGTL